MNSVETGIDWHQVPLDCLGAWSAVFRSSQETLNLSSPCALCGVPKLHRWYLVGQPIDSSFGGTHYVARGALWEWCSACGAFVHYSASVPDWWSCGLVVDMSQVKITPESIEQARRMAER